MTMGRFWNLLLVAIAWPSAAAKKQPSFLPRAVLDVRGGAGPLDVTDTAKLSTLVCGIGCGPQALSPEKATEFYGLDPSKPSDVLTARRIGVTVLSCAVMGYSLFFKSKSVHEAVGLGALPWALEALKTLLDDTPSKLGFSNGPQAFILAVQTLVAYALLGNNSFMDKDLVMKIFAAWAAANGLFLGLAPETALSMWGRSSGALEDSLSYLISCEGFALMGYAAYVGALALGSDATTACGYSSIPWFVWFAKVLFVTKEVEKFNQPQIMQYVWLVLNAVFVGTLAIPAKAAETVSATTGS